YREVPVEFSAVPSARGLYDPRYESDSCGVAFIADLQGRASPTIVAPALAALHNLPHRGAAGAEPSSGDGAGMTVQIPDAFLREISGGQLPPAGAYATGLAFLPVDPRAAADAVALVEQVATEEGLIVLGWREVPTNPAGVGATGQQDRTRVQQHFISAEP